MRAHRIGADQVGRQCPDVGPAHPIGVEDRSVHTGADEPGAAVVAAHRQYAGHADADAAGHRLFDRDLRPDGMRAGDLAAVGALLTASHRSSQKLFENSTPELDALVDTLVATPHVYGARLTGGGFGGAVMALTSEKFGDAEAQSVAEAYAKKFGARPDILHTQTGDGAQLIS